MKKKLWQPILIFVIFMMAGAVIGFVLGPLVSPALSKDSFEDTMFLLALIFVFFILATFAHTIIHEGGHLVFGLLTGYKFCSFRIFSITFIKLDGKIKIKKLSIVGTGGQCLLSPPHMVDGKFPFTLYNLGGVIMNAVFSSLALVVALLVWNTDLLTTALIIFCVCGFALAAINGIPMSLGVVNNDGRNQIEMSKSPEAAFSFWTQLSINALAAEGVRVKDMPDEWFYLPTDDSLKNSMTAALAVIYCNRLMDRHSFDEAYQQMNRLLETDTDIIALPQSLIYCDRIYCELIGENRSDLVESMMSKEQRKFMRAMKDYPTVQRTEYAYALLAEKNVDKAESIKASFEKRATTYPYSSDIESERELMEIALNSI